MRIILAITVTLLSLSFAKASESQKPVVNSTSQVLSSDIKGQIADLERENRNLKDDLARLDKKHKELADDIEDYKPFLEHWKLIIGGLLGLGSLVAGVTYFYKIPAAAKEVFDSKIQKIFTDRREDFLAMLKGYDLDQEIKKRHKVILLTHPNGNDSYHHDLLIKHGFSVEPYTRVGTLAQTFATITVTADDIVIINNEDAHWQMSEVHQFIHSTANCCFYIGRGAIDLQGDAINRFAAASFRAQFIGNLMNILKYRIN
jgi:NADH/NAD ratio-sensing transcriptional regulator Rex